jgi:hypothetical protein
MHSTVASNSQRTGTAGQVWELMGSWWALLGR